MSESIKNILKDTNLVVTEVKALFLKKLFRLIFRKVSNVTYIGFKIRFMQTFFSREIQSVTFRVKRKH